MNKKILATASILVLGNVALAGPPGLEPVEVRVVEGSETITVNVVEKPLPTPYLESTTVSNSGNNNQVIVDLPLLIPMGQALVLKKVFVVTSTVGGTAEVRRLQSTTVQLVDEFGSRIGSVPLRQTVTFEQEIGGSGLSSFSGEVEIPWIFRESASLRVVVLSATALPITASVDAVGELVNIPPE